MATYVHACALPCCSRAGTGRCRPICHATTACMHVHAWRHACIITCPRTSRGWSSKGVGPRKMPMAHWPSLSDLQPSVGSCLRARSSLLLRVVVVHSSSTHQMTSTSCSRRHSDAGVHCRPNVAIIFLMVWGPINAAWVLLAMVGPGVICAEG